MTDKKTRGPNKPKPRHPHLVSGALRENLNALSSNPLVPDLQTYFANRALMLCDELDEAMGFYLKKTGAENE